MIEHNEVPQNQAERLTEKFFNFYESKDWYVGKNKMKNWRAAANNWIANATKFSKQANENNNYLHVDQDKDYSIPL